MKRPSHIVKGGIGAACACSLLALALGGYRVAVGAENRGAEATPPVTAETFQADREFLQRYEQKMPEATPLPGTTVQKGALPPAETTNAVMQKEAMIASGRVEAAPVGPASEPVRTAPEPATAAAEASRKKTETARTKAKPARNVEEEEAPAPIAEKSVKPRKVTREPEQPVATRDSAAPPRRQTVAPVPESRSSARRSKAMDDVGDEPATSTVSSRRAASEAVPVRRAVAVSSEQPGEESEDAAPRRHRLFSRIHIFHKDRDGD